MISIFPTSKAKALRRVSIEFDRVDTHARAATFPKKSSSLIAAEVIEICYSKYENRLLESKLQKMSSTATLV